MTRRALARVVAAAALAFGGPATAGEPSPAASPQPASHARMVATLAEIARESRDTDVYTGDLQLRAFRAQLAAAGDSAPPSLRFVLLRQVAFHELRLGDPEAAIARLHEALALVQPGAGTPPPLDAAIRAEELDRTQFALAVAYLRWGESRNCVALHSSESCIAPIAAGGRHTDPEGSRRAIEQLEKLLARRSDHLPARWLLNIAYMTIGGYPDGVPAAWRVPERTFAAEEAFPPFVDRAAALGIDGRELGGGVAIDDFDGDGRLDIVVSSFDPAAALRFFAGRADGAFSERTREAGLEGITGGGNVVHGDFDGDGALDLLVLRGGWLGREGRRPMSLLRNDGRGVFTDVTFDSGLGEVFYPSQSAAWADYDNDGDLDLYVGNEWSDNQPFPSQLFRNDGAGRFVDVAAAAGVENRRLAKGVAWGDFDGDGWQDLYVSNLNGDNRLYRNRGDGTFVDVAAAAAVAMPWSSQAVVTFDYDDDGRLDLFVGAAARAHAAELVTNRSRELADLTASIASALGQEIAGETGRLYRNLGDMRFQDVTAEQRLDRVILTGGIGVGDLDGDGAQDLYVSASYAGFEGLLPNRLFRNRGAAGFADVTTAAGLGHLQKAGGIAVADLDGDGDQDIFLNAGGLFRGDVFPDALFLNDGPPRRHLRVRLAGTRSNRAAIGARLRLDVIENGQPRSLWRTVGAGSSFGGNPLAQHFGQGKAKPVQLTVHWPSGLVQEVRVRGENLDVKEGEE